MLGAVLVSPTMTVVLVLPWLLCTFLVCWTFLGGTFVTCLSVLSFAPSWTQHKFDFGPVAPSGTLSGQAIEFKGLPQFERDFASFFVGLLVAMAALSLLQFGNPGMPSFLGDFFGAGYFMFDFKGLLWSFMVPVVVAAAMLAAAGRDVFVCGGAPFAWRCPTCFQPLREPPLLDAMLAALLVFLWYIFVQTVGLLFVFSAGFCQNWYLTGSWVDFYMLINAPDFGMGKEKGLKFSLFIQEVVKRSPFQVGIEAVPQLGSCINVGISAAAQVPVMAAALKECCVSVASDGVSLLYNVPLTLVFKCVALAAAAFTAAAAFGAFCGAFTLVTLQIVLVGDFLFAFVGLVAVTQQQAAAAGVTMPQRQRLHHGWTWVTTLRRQASIRQWDRTKLKVKRVPKHKSSKSLPRTWLERRWWCGVSPGWTRCLWSSVTLSRSLVFRALFSTWLVPLVVGFGKMSLWSRVVLGPTPLCS